MEGLFDVLKDFLAVKYPELIVGLAGPIGVDVEAITESVESHFRNLGYRPIVIQITDEINSLKSGIQGPKNGNFYEKMKFKMQHASALCRLENDAAYLMRIAITAIRRERAKIIAEGGGLIDEDRIEELKKMKEHGEDIDPTLGAAFYFSEHQQNVAARVVYIVRQIKRPEEVELMRRVYNRQFILLSAYASELDRANILNDKIRHSLSPQTKDSKIKQLSADLIERDASEDDDEYGQHLRDAFHIADVFIDGINKQSMDFMVKRFLDALFGKNSIAPTKTEYGMYTAKSAALRSSDLSRQVGAAIFSEDGEIIAQGCNEVPKAFGGTYWDNEEPDNRDIKIGVDPNDILKREIVRDLLDKLLNAEILNERIRKIGDAGDMVDHLTSKTKSEEDKSKGALSSAMILDLTEYGRVVHAEMCAICDSARIGRPLKNTILYCTTFPCHNCTKHILAAGIKRVVFMEPYPKSKAKELHQNEIELDHPSVGKVAFLPFLGIAPFRYRDVFEKGKRKANGIAEQWYQENEPIPMVDVLAPSYTELEGFAIRSLFGDTVKDESKNK